MKLVFATGNVNKVREISKQLGGKIELVGLKDIGCLEEIPETTGTIQGNAIQKAQYVYDKYGMDCFAEDTGLEVTALDMEPGVDTAMYAGEERDANANMDKVLVSLQDKEDRTARFRTVIAFVRDGEVRTFEGIVNGNIAMEKTGEKGFGYDPIFRPEEEGRTFAEMTDEEKNQISHRARAMAKFMDFLSL